MNTRMTRIVSVALWMLATPASIAQAGQAGQTSVQGESARRYLDEARGLLIEDLVTLALDKAPSILASRARVDMTRGELTQAGVRPNPMVMFERRDEVGGPDNQTTLGVVWPIDEWRRDARTNVARQQITGAGLQQADVERLLAASVRRQAARLLAAVRQLDVRERIWIAAQQTRDLLAARAESGAGTLLDRDLADVESRRAEADAVRQRAETDVALSELKALVGLPPDAPLLLRESLEASVRRTIAAQVPTLNALTAAGLADARSDVRAADSEVATAKARTDLFRSEGRPEVSVSGSYMRMNAGFDQLAFGPGGQLTPIRALFHNLAFGATISLPWQNRQQGAVASAMAAEQVARHDREALKLVVSAEIDAARIREQHARRVWDIYAGGLRDLAARNLEVTRESQRLGRATLVDVLAETRRYLEVETSCTEALLDLLTARIALSSAMGVVR